MRLAMSRLLTTKLVASLAFTMIATAAFAHAQLQKAVPAVGGVVTASPTEIRLNFSEGVEPRFSGVQLQAADGQVVGTGAASVDPADKSTLIIPVKSTLAPGSYKVTWHVVSVDTHKTQGSFTFTVKP
jgi:methionine-rich copper-binding protein CopC